MAMSSSSSRVFLKKYDVFISFRGEDTRNNFTHDLYSALRKENIIAYIDNQLERGDDIWPALVKAIKDSVIAVVVFSERYATSRWCLQELAQIMECRRLGGLAVIPVFYKTNPTDVRKQTGSYQKPFDDHDKREEQDKVESWRDALTQAANISGWESRTQGDNSQVIENLVKNVWGKLRSMENDYQEGLVLIDEQCEAIEGSSGKLGRIGLWGMGGTGKTTIAKALFANHSPEYDSVCFLKDIREESQIHGLAHIRDKLLFDLLKDVVVAVVSLTVMEIGEDRERKMKGFTTPHFYSKNIKFWQSELRNLELRRKSFKEIQDVFKVSYHGLSRQEQAIFLDIAIFFKDRNQDSVISILDACGFNAASGIEKLKDKALITISKTNTIQMLDFLQDMAFDIVRNDVTDPRRGTILMNDDCLQLCSSEGTPQVVEGALLNLSRSSHRYKFNDEMFSLPKLRILKFYVGSVMSTHISFSKSENEYDSYRDYYHYDYQLPGSAELKYFEWAGYPSKSLPITFCVKFLVEFRMPYSHVEELWDGTQNLVNLETIDLSECKKLRKLPDLYKASKLKWVNLTGCESLQVLHPSLLSVDTLVTLTLDRCKKLESVMSEQHLSKLQNLNLNDCQNLKEFSVSSDSIKLLDLSKTRVRQLYPSIGRLSDLLWLSLEDLDLENLPDELSCLTSLEELRISDCGVIDKEKLHVIFAGLGSLKVLHLKDCYRKFELPDNISALSSLQELRLDGS
ncbi:disease resistance protein RPV1-like [Lotus japonicus]|uniref:disease resistance protein RPV1-like n=1 Tax=Lotus japonicus TaxID=34305 RepID=UPI002588FAD5|nr:disease resistance protein RPV1-like [Lotus japonicus]